MKNTVVTPMMEAASTSESTVNFYQTTRRNIPAESHVHVIDVTVYMAVQRVEIR
jgi:hypothetical protein